jgi:hypothetical protein
MKRLKNILIGISVIAAFLLTNSTEAQNLNNSRFGIKGGFNVSNLLDNDAESSKINLGINGGIFLRIAVNSMFSFQPEFIYTMKGGTIEYNNFVNGIAKISVNYLEVPLLAVFNITKNVNLQGGIYLASLADVRVRNKDGLGSYNFENLNKDDFKSFDYGLACGIGVDFDKLSAGLRYDYGVRSIGDKKTFGGESIRFPDAKNSAFQIYIGLSIL